ncbi:phospho-sugar mutase [Berryella wangjianweii]|uniref:Phospho-sugar mutase n=1 Tax=Berryella wangjianweii TaxID=2734634 RepID=A0A6M8J6W4_9ACTN|nr:phospho-sugar mutase [Berryella wangjianweii]QKF07626.1 phospho-sugar mutase [Berryella wangjianweii]
MTDFVQQRFQEWDARARDPFVRDDLERLRASDDSAALADAFFQELTFGTAGLRGIIGAGTNRMNVYTVGRATQGLANYLMETFPNPSVAIARDSRHKGEEFTRHAAAVLAANGVRVWVYPRVEPTPALSFAVRHLGTSAGICMTASHNPAPYNGYKVYGPDGCQIATSVADAVSAHIERVDAFCDVRTMPFDDAVRQGLVSWIGEDTLDAYVDAVVASSADMGAEGPLRVVYTPLCGAGRECVERVLERIGVDEVMVVPEQGEPDGAFPTCEYPNPEERAALERGLALCRQVEPDLLLATDPDADRVGVAVRAGDEDVLLSGNEVGALLLDYLARVAAHQGRDLSQMVAVTTIVSTTLADSIAREWGFEVRRVLTGFKYIGGVIAQLEQQGAPERFLLGFEESYGYLNGAYVRDKDAVNACMLICQMARYYKREGLSLADAMDRLYRRHGYCRNRTLSFAFPGAEGATRMASLMEGLRTHAPQEMAGLAVVEAVDYRPGARGLPPADVVELVLEGGCKVIFRPSGTEPKVKAYLFATASEASEADDLCDRLAAVVGELVA